MHLLFIIPILFFSLFTVSVVSAESVPEYSLSNVELLSPEDDVLYSPYVGVENLTLDQAAYIAGETISGEFLLINTATTTDIPDVLYEVQLVGEFKIHRILNQVQDDNNVVRDDKREPTAIFDRTIINKDDPTVLLPGEKRKITFSYDLPEVLPATDLGMRVQTYIGNKALTGREAITFAITGQTNNDFTYIAQTQVGGKPYGLSSSPVIYQNGQKSNRQLLFAVSLRNNTNVTKTLVPKVSIYDRLTTGEKITSFDGKEITVNRGSTGEQRILLPDFDYQPGFYTALITYVDSESGNEEIELIKKSVIGPFEVRYQIEDTTDLLEILRPTQNTASKQTETASRFQAGQLFSIGLIVFGVILISLLLVLVALRRTDH